MPAPYSLFSVLPLQGRRHGQNNCFFLSLDLVPPTVEFPAFLTNSPSEHHPPLYYGIAVNIVMQGCVSIMTSLAPSVYQWHVGITADPVPN